MTSSLTGSPPPGRTQTAFPWFVISWVSALLAACYAPIIYRLARQWFDDPDMGHGFFVPIIAGYIAWLNRGRIAGIAPQPNWWGLAIVAWGALQLYVGTLGAELFLSRTSLVITIIGAVLLLGGTTYLRVFGFPLFLLFFMIPIPAVVYNSLTFPLQMRASETAEWAIDFLGIPIIREGNVLELSSGKLNVVEACSGIRSLLTLTFLSLVYGYFAEKRTWIRIVLFFATIPIAILANAGRVTMTGIASEIKPELAAGLFHEAEGWVIFMVAFVILVILHQAIVRTASLIAGRRAVHA